MNLTVANDGVFWMPYDVFLKYYMNVAVAMYQPYQYETVNLKAVKRQYDYKITNPEKQ